MTRRGKMLLWGAAAVGAFWLWRKRQMSIMPGAAAAAAGAPSTAVSPTAAPTTANMKALAGYINPTMDHALSGGYGRLPVAYPGNSSPTIRRIIGG